MPTTITGKIERKYMAHLLNTAGFNGSTDTASWYRLGEDLEEYNIDLNPDTELVKNILGNTRFDFKGYEPSSESDPFYARVGDALFVKLQDIVDNRYTGDQCKTDALEVHLWDGDDTAGYTAYRQPCYVVPSSYGGDTSGYQIPFTVNYVGDRVKGKYVPGSAGASGTFTPNALG